MKPRSRLAIHQPALNLAITLVVSHLPHARGADGIWTGGTGFNEWSATTNWSGGVLADGTDSTAEFSSTNSLFSPVVLDSARTVGHLTFGLPDGDTWELNDNSAPANVLTLAVSAGTPTIAVNGYNTTATIGVSIAGTSGFTKTGQGALILAGINSYTGTTIVKEGLLFLDQNGALGSGNNLTVEADTPLVEGGFLNLGNTTQTVGAVTINGTGDKVSDGDLVATSYSLVNDSVAADGCGCSGSFISAGLGGTGANLTKSGVGTTYLSGTNTYTGTTTVTGGTLIFDKTASLYNGQEAEWTPANISVASGATLGVSIGVTGEFSVAQAKTLLTNLTTAINNNGLQAGSSFAIDTTFSTTDVTFDQVITDSIGTGSGALGFTKEGDGKLILNQANTYTGPTTVRGGILAIEGAGTLGNQADLIVSGDFPELDLGGTTQTVGAATFNNAFVHNGNLTADSYTVESGIIESGLGGTGTSLTKSGAADSIAYLSGTNTYTGTTTVTGGTLVFDTPASLYNSQEAEWTLSNISVTSGATLGVSIGDTGEFSLAQAKTLLTNLTTAINNNGLQAGSTFAIDTTYSATDVTFDQVIADSTGTGGGALGFTKEGDGKLILNQANTYTGPTTIWGGTLQFAQTASLYNGNTAKWTAADITVTPGTTLAVNVGGTGEFSVAQSKTLLNNLTTSINNNGLQAFSTFAIDTTNATGTTTFDQVIADSTGTSGAGPLGFAKLGTNTLILDQDSTYTGLTFVEGGTLVVNGNISTSLGTIVLSGATLGGSGNVGAVAVEAGGTIDPGNSPGILNTGNLYLEGTLNTEIFGTTVGTEYDQINVTGTVELYGLLSLMLTSFTPNLGDLFFLINNDYVDGIDGEFSGLAQDANFNMGGQQWMISYTADFDSDAFYGGNDLALMAVPEPSAALMGGLGLMALLRLRRRG